MIKDEYSEIPDKRKRWRLRHPEKYKACYMIQNAKLVHPNSKLTSEEKIQRRKQTLERYRLKHIKSHGPEYRNKLVRNALQLAVRKGKLIRPKDCSKCGNTRQIQAHHPDYSKPLEVIWLCSCCHIDVHKSP